MALVIGTALAATGIPAQPANAAPPPGQGAPAVAAGRSIPAATPATAHALETEDVDAWLDGFLPASLASSDIAGATVVVVKDGKVVTQRGFGYADVEKRTPVDPEKTLFRPGSVSKLFTWTAVMQLVERGKLDLDADVNEYLDFSIPARDGKPVTLRNIMTHTAGFEEQVKDILGTDPDTVPSYEALLKRWVPRRIYPPGTTPAYSNYATSLAGYVVERTSGEPFAAYMQRHILRPLAMTRSTFEQPLPESLRPSMSTGYEVASGEPAPFEIVGPVPAGALSATGADMGRFMIAHLQDGELDGQRILKPETARQMHDTALTVVPPLNRMMLGFFETNLNGRQVIGHLGDTNAFHTSLHLFEREKTGLYVSFNSGGTKGAAGTLRVALFQQFADRYFPGQPDTRRVDDATSAEHARMLAGNWVNSRRSGSNFLDVISLVGQVEVGVDGDGRLDAPVTPGFNGKPRQWVEVEPFVWHDPDSHERLAAVVEDGEVVRFSIDLVSPFIVFERAPWYRSSAVLLPLLYATLAVLVLTVLLWPVRALVRRHFGVTLDLRGRDLAAYRTSRVAALMMLAVCVGWGFTVNTMLTTVELHAGWDPVIWTLEFLTFVAFVGGTAALAWNLWAVWRGGRRWPAKAWSVALVAAGAVLVWTGAAFHLLSLGVNY